MQETSIDVPKAQSPTLMIQGMLDELALEGEASEMPGVAEEEEGSSSTPGKEDVEDGRANSVNKSWTSRLSSLSPCY